MAAVVNSRVVGIPDSTSAIVSINLTGAATARLKVGTDSAVTQNVVYGPAGTPNAQGDVRLTVSGLTTSTRQFYYRVASTPSGGTESLDTLTTVGQFRTAPTGAASFNFTFGSCSNAADPAVFSVMAARGDDLFLHLGDLYYADGTGTDITNFRAKFADRLPHANHQALLATTASVYTPSDHDSMNDNTGAGDDPTAWANWNQVYREKWPTPSTIPATNGVYFTFVWGRVRFIVLDGRSFKSPLAATDDSTKTKLGTTQKQWLKNTINAATEPAIIVAQESPWEGNVIGDDNWAEYSTERTELGNFFAGSGKKIIMLGGDMHALAADNGTDTVGNIVLFQAAPFENASSVKGGPYTSGPYPAVTDYNNTYRQYGRVQVTDDGTSVTLVYSGYSSDNVVHANLTTTIAGAAPVTPSASTLPFTETFTGTTGASWGANWTLRNAGALETIQNNTGQLTTAAAAYSYARADFTGMSANGDTDITGTIALPATGGVEQYAAVSINGDGTGTNDTPNNSYALTFNFPDQQIKLRTTSAGTNTTVLAVGKTLNGGTTYSFRFQRIGQVLKGRLWTGTEPVTWDLSYTLTGTPLTGIVGLSVGNGNDGVARSAVFDNLTVSNPSAISATASAALSGTGTLSYSTAAPIARTGSAALSGTGTLAATGIANVGAPSASTLPYTETFTGTTGATWNTNWTLKSPASGSTSIQGNAGQITCIAGVYTSARADLTGMPGAGDTDVTGTFTMPATGGVEQYLAVSINGDGNGNSDTPTNSYAMTASYADQQISLRTTINYTNTTVATVSKTLIGGTAYSFRVQRIGQALKAKVWTGTEPTAWDVAYTIVGAPLVGIVGLAVANGNDGVSRSAIYDNITVSNPSASTGTTTASGQPKIWTGSAWVAKSAKIWTGSAWAVKPVKRWTGSAWATVGPATTTGGTGPNGPSSPTGAWSMVFNDEFDGPTLNTSVWSYGNVNNTTTNAANVTFANSCVQLKLASTTSGAEIYTTNNLFLVGDYIEWRANFPGSGTSLYNWPALWTSGPSWPAAGEIDIAEVLGGQLTMNYHGTTNSVNYNGPSGYWGDQFHTFGCYRHASTFDVYWDGVLVLSGKPTGDNGAGQNVIANMGYDSSAPTSIGASLLVDYVRTYRPV